MEFTNAFKQKFFDLTMPALNDICATILKNEIEKSTRVFLTEKVASFIQSKSEKCLYRLYDTSIDKYRDEIISKIQEYPNIGYFKFRAVENFLNYIKKYGEIIEERLESHCNLKLTDLTQKCISKMGDLGLISFEKILEIKVSIFCKIIVLMENKYDKECLKIIANGDLQRLYDHVFEKYKPEIDEWISYFFSRNIHNHISQICNVIEKVIINFLAEEISSFISLEWNRIINYQFIINAAYKDIQIEAYKILAKSTSPKSTDHYQEKHLWIQHGEKGFTYENIFGEYFENVKEIILVETYIKSYYQYDNLLHFCQLITKYIGINKLHIITKSITHNQTNYLRNKFNSLHDQLYNHNIKLSYEFSYTIHDREIILDNGWIIKIGRGLDIYLPPSGDKTDLFDFILRPCKETKVDIFRAKYITNNIRKAA